MSKRNLPAILKQATPEVSAEMLKARVRRPQRVGLALIVLFLGGAGAWSTLVDIPAGAVAPGIISPDGSRKTVQHLEGGIIAVLHVRDGDQVASGQPLLTMESIQASTTYEALLSQYRTLLVTRARLEAEQLGYADMRLPPEVRAHADEPTIKTVIAGQKAIFDARAKTHATNRRVLQQRIEQSHEQIAALRAQLQSATRQLDLIEEELVGKEELRKKNIISKPELLKLQRAQAEIRGRQGEYAGTISRVKQQIGETETQLLALDAQRVDQISTQMDQVRLELSVLTERLTASRDILKRTIVSAPVSGKIVNLRFKTEGGVVQKGEPLMDIVPIEDKLLIDARVAPTDVDVVHQGLTALIHLTAFSNRGIPRIHGKVRSVSADRLQDSPTTPPYYLARVEVDKDDLIGAQTSIELVPGMPAEVLIVTAERTMLQYLIEPFRQAFWRSFREV